MNKLQNKWHSTWPTIAMIAAVSVLGAPRAWADDAPCGPEPSPEQKRNARALHKQAFELHKQLRFDEAAATYVRSLELWPDPRVHLQAGIAFLSALRLLEAHAHIDEALRCGRDVLEPDKLAEAENKLQRLHKRLGQVSVSCREPGAQVRFNDAPWFVCPGQKTRMVVAGQYVITVTKDGHFPVLKPVTVAAGERVVVDPTVLSIREGTRVTRRWPVWVPWALIGAGAAVGAVGSSLQWRARAHMDDYQQAVAEQCPPAACTREDAGEVLSEQDRAIFNNRLALGAFAVSGATLITGLTLLYLNRSQSRQRPEAGSARVRVMPMAARDSAGVSVGLTF